MISFLVTALYNHVFIASRLVEQGVRLVVKGLLLAIKNIGGRICKIRGFCTFVQLTYIGGPVNLPIRITGQLDMPLKK